jgi:CubicO group peptidase (beta-lactamase class C family)
MRLFILFIPILLFFSSASFSQSNNQYKDLPSEYKKVIRNKLKAMSAEDKILSFVLLNEQYVNGIDYGIGGILLKSTEPTQTFTATASSEMLRIVNLTKVKNYDKLPFPAKKTRIKARTPLPTWLPGIFDANYLVDLDTLNQHILFYGLDSTGNYFNNKPYQSWDSLFSATIHHDLIYTPLAPELLLSQISGLKIKSPQRKSLADKLTQKLIEELHKHDKPIKSPAKIEVLQWVWQTYTSATSLISASELLPITSLDSINLCSFSFNNEQFKDFSEGLNRYAAVPNYKPNTSSSKDLRRLAAYDLVIIPASSLSDHEIEFVQALATKTVVLIMAFAYDTNIFTGDERIKFVSIPEDNWLSQSITAQSMFGANQDVGCSNRLQYGIPDLVGMNPRILMLIDNVVDEALTAQAIPGCQILVAKDGVVVFDKAYGYQTYDSTNKISKNTMYDLASITKVLATTQGIMHLVEHDTITLDAPLGNYLEYLDNTNKKDITIRQIMAHQAGLYPYYPFWKRARKVLDLDNHTYKEVQVGRSIWVNSAVEDSVLYWAATSDLLAERIDTITHEQYMYSDIGFYLLKDLIEQQTSMSLDKFLSKQLYQPLGTSLVFNPTCYFPVAELAPTEIDNLLRNELVQGFVHDRNAALMGGVAGQAGLFGNANDVAVMLQLQLNGGCYGGRRYFESATIKQFLSRQYDNNRRGLGWDMPGTEPDGPVSELASNETFGHTGFTGGSIWADPKESLIFVFLSNRVYPSVENTKLIDMNIRTRIQDIVYRAINK